MMPTELQALYEFQSSLTVIGTCWFNKPTAFQIEEIMLMEFELILIMEIWIYSRIA